MTVAAVVAVATAVSLSVQTLPYPTLHHPRGATDASRPRFPPLQRPRRWSRRELPTKTMTPPRTRHHPRTHPTAPPWINSESNWKTKLGKLDCRGGCNSTGSVAVPLVLLLLLLLLLLRANSTSPRPDDAVPVLTQRAHARTRTRTYYSPLLHPVSSCNPTSQASPIIRFPCLFIGFSCSTRPVRPLFPLPLHLCPSHPYHPHLLTPSVLMCFRERERERERARWASQAAACRDHHVGASTGSCSLQKVTPLSPPFRMHRCGASFVHARTPAPRPAPGHQTRRY